MYGNLEDVAALVPRLAGASGLFTTSTRPTEYQVNVWLEQVSAQVDVVLAASGFSTPIEVLSIVAAIDGFVNQEVAAICEGVNGSGRFGPTAKAPHNKGRLSFWAVVNDDIQMFVSSSADGFEALGATRASDNYAGISFRQYDDDGSAVEPLFQRQMFGERYIMWGGNA